MGYELDKLKRQYGVGTANIASYAGQTLGAPPAETASAADKAAFEDQLRKYQIDQRAYKAYTDEYANRLANTNMYAQPQFNTNPNTATPPAPRTPLNPITYGAIPANVSAATDQGAMYKQMRDVGYTDADIRAATSKITGSPNEQKWSEMLNVAYPQYQPAITSAYQQLGRSGFGADPAQIDYGGYNYWLNQLSSGAVKPEDLNKAVLTAGRPANYGEIESIYQQYFNRAPDPSGVQTWGKSGLTGDALYNAITTGAQGNDLAYYNQNFGNINQIYQKNFNRLADRAGLDYWAKSGLTGDALNNAIIAGAQGPDLSYYLSQNLKNALGGSDDNAWTRAAKELNSSLGNTGAVNTGNTGTVGTGNTGTTTTTTPPIYGDINQIYQQYFNRPAEQEGLNYWAQSGFTGDTLKNAIIAGAQGPDLAYYQQNFMQSPDPYYAGGPGEGGGAARGGYISKYAEGGRVRTHYQTGGMADEGNLDELDAFYRDPRNFTRPTPLGPARTYQEMMREAMPTVGPVRGLPTPGETIAIGEGGTLQPMGGEPSMPMVAGAPAVEPNPAEAVGDPIQAAAAPAAPRQPSIQDLLARYGGGSGEGSRELAGARQRYQSEANAFSDMIRQMSERAESPTSRAEMYFRLAAAFGSPTRTGSMGETLSKVGEQMGEYTKGRRAEEAERRGLMLRAQEARLAGAREDLQTTRALSAQEASERRAITSQLLQQYIRSGEPQSNAGRMARDMGLTPGTPAFNEFVQRNSELNIERTNQMMQAQAEILRLRTEAADRLSPTEIKMAEETMQNVAAGRDNLSALRRALELNESSSPDNLTQGTITRLRAALGSEAPIVVNTRELNNMLERLTLSSLKETFPGAISNDERRALQAVQGIGAKSLEERRRIIRNAIESLERVIPRNEEHFRNVRSGSFGRIER